MTPSSVLRRRQRAGFTLIELVVTMAIIAIIAGIAIPSYGAYTRKAHRADAQQYMMDMTVRQGEILLDSRAYADQTAMLAVMPTPGNVSTYYDITLTTSAAPPAFTITATAKGSQTADGNLTINNSGAKTPADKW